MKMISEINPSGKSISPKSKDYNYINNNFLKLNSGDNNLLLDI